MERTMIRITAILLVLAMTAATAEAKSKRNGTRKATATTVRVMAFNSKTFFVDNVYALQRY
jgi:hypothetical protein